MPTAECHAPRRATEVHVLGHGGNVVVQPSTDTRHGIRRDNGQRPLPALLPAAHIPGARQRRQTVWNIRSGHGRLSR